MQNIFLAGEYKIRNKAIRLLAVVLSVLMMASLLPTISFTVFSETEGIFKYEIESGNAVITGLVDSDYSGDVVIPSTIGGYSVTSIKSYAFSYYNGITGVTIPVSVKENRKFYFL